MSHTAFIMTIMEKLDKIEMEQPQYNSFLYIYIFKLDMVKNYVLAYFDKLILKDIFLKISTF